MQGDADAAVEAVYRSDWGRIVAALIRLVGDFELAEEAAQEAFAAAVDQWRTAGIPEFPRAWIIQTARHKAIDRIRRLALHKEKVESYAASALNQTVLDEPDYDTTEIADDRLRLIFTCCHPALAPESADRADVAYAGWLGYRRNRARVSRSDVDHGTTPGAGPA